MNQTLNRLASATRLLVLVWLFGTAAVAALGPAVQRDIVHVVPLRPQMHIRIDALANDSHPEGRALTVTGVTQPQLGSVSPPLPDGTVTLTLSESAPIERQSISFAYTLTHGAHPALTGQVCVGLCPVAIDPLVCPAERPAVAGVARSATSASSSPSTGRPNALVHLAPNAPPLGLDNAPALPSSRLLAYGPAALATAASQLAPQAARSPP